MAGKKKTVEENFEILDQMVRRMESSDISLEESFQLYQDGMKLLKEVNGTIDRYEKKIQVLTSDGTTEDLDA